MNTTYQQILKDRAAAEMHLRKIVQERARDSGLETAIIAFANHRCAGGETKWEDFRREWIRTTKGD